MAEVILAIPQPSITWGHLAAATAPPRPRSVTPPPEPATIAATSPRPMPAATAPVAPGPIRIPPERWVISYLDMFIERLQQDVLAPLDDNDDNDDDDASAPSDDDRDAANENRSPSSSSSLGSTVDWQAL